MEDVKILNLFVPLMDNELFHNLKLNRSFIKNCKTLLESLVIIKAKKAIRNHWITQGNDIVLSLKIPHK